MGTIAAVLRLVRTALSNVLFVLAACGVLGACKRGALVSLDADAGDASTEEAPLGHVEVGATAAVAPLPKYTSRDGGYEVRFPYPDVTPDLATQPIVGGVEHLAKVNGKYGTFLVGWDDTLRSVGGASSRVLDDIVNRTIKTNGGKKLSAHAVSLPIPFGAPHPKGRTSWDGREVSATFIAKDKSPADAHWRLYLVGTRVYQLLSLAPKGKEVPPEVLKEFFDSFAPTTPGATPSVTPAPSASASP